MTVTLNDIVNMFGTCEAKENFLRLCREYYGERVRQEVAMEFGHPAMNSRRAELHALIMVIVQKLFLRYPQTMPSRKRMGEMIMQFVRDESGKNQIDNRE